MFFRTAGGSPIGIPEQGICLIFQRTRQLCLRLESRGEVDCSCILLRAPQPTFTRTSGERKRLEDAARKSILSRPRIDSNRHCRRFLGLLASVSGGSCGSPGSGEVASSPRFALHSRHRASMPTDSRWARWAWASGMCGPGSWLGLSFHWWRRTRNWQGRH